MDQGPCELPPWFPFVGERSGQWQGAVSICECGAGRVCGLCATLVHRAAKGVWSEGTQSKTKGKGGGEKMVDFSLFLGKMHADVHWQRTSGAVFHLPDGGGPDSWPQQPTRLGPQPPERRAPAPLCHWWGPQRAEAVFAVSLVFVFHQSVLQCASGGARCRLWWGTCGSPGHPRRQHQADHPPIPPAEIQRQLHVTRGEVCWLLIWLLTFLAISSFGFAFHKYGPLMSTLFMRSVQEIAVVGPPNLFRVGFKTVGPLATMTMAWVRSQNKLAQLLPICFAVNTQRCCGCRVSEAQYYIRIHTITVSAGCSI